MLNLDTHIVIHLLDGGLTSAEIEILRGKSVGISAIVLWELAQLHQKARIAYGPGSPNVSAFLRKCHVWPIDVEVSIASTRLDVTNDPADEIIGATSVVHRVPLLIRDFKLRASNRIPLAS